MKKHKDAFHREYEEFGPVSEWTPDSTASSLPIPGAARELGKHFDLRGELATIQHVRRAQCRLRLNTPYASSRLCNKHQSGSGHMINTGQHPKRQPEEQDAWDSEKSHPMRTISSLEDQCHDALSQCHGQVSQRHDQVRDERFPKDLQFLYLPPARSGIAVVDSKPTQTQSMTK
eukprot:TRINITY_DN8829_c0_g1_i2.p1 TRINITY_DN8829_c0_g1~~TRINITY_DN8829_c0_g1_i2.p1  ORF type:complete len:174 (-),score=23.24 TRINITY_DN8829_c0_g1_i2:180-701(-)